MNVEHPYPVIKPSTGQRSNMLLTFEPVTYKSQTHNDNMDYVLDASDVIGMYFKEIRQFPLLNKQEEIDLTTTMAKGRTFSGKTKTVDTMHLTPEAEEAKIILTNSNLLLVVSRAKKSAGRGIPFSDLIQAGNMGLMKGIAKFEPERGFKLSTYCTWWIDQAIGREIRNFGQSIHLPIHFYDWLQYVRSEKHILTQQLGRNPTIYELAEAVGSDPTYVNEALAVAEKPISLDRPINEDSDSDEFIDMVDLNQPIIDVVYEDNDIQDLVRKAYVSIPDSRQRVIFGLRYGFIDGKIHTYEEIGKMFHFTRQRTEQILRQGMANVKKYIRQAKLRKEDVS